MSADVCVLIPAYRAAATVAAVVRDVEAAIPSARGHVLVVDDGSEDGTDVVAKAAGARVVRHVTNRGKGAALLTGMRDALGRGYGAALTVDADGQHPGASCRAVWDAAPLGALALGVRDLVGAGAPRKNQFSNAVSNYFLSRFSGHPLRDTQCGLRRYPLRETLALGAQETGYAFEAEVLLLALAASIPVVQLDVRVIYPPERERVTHFDGVRDPARIIRAVLRTLARLRGYGPGFPSGAPSKP